MLCKEKKPHRIRWDSGAAFSCLSGTQEGKNGKNY